MLDDTASIGQSFARLDGAEKVMGKAQYTADVKLPGLIYAVIATSSIAKGRVTHLDVAAAAAHPGVVKVMTPANAPKLAKSPDEKGSPFELKLDLLQNNRVRYANQPIAVVIAETLEAASEGVVLLRPQYEIEKPAVLLGDAPFFEPPAVGAGQAGRTVKGDVDAALSTSAARIEAAYDLAPEYHNPMEPHAVTSLWEDGRLTVYTSTQGLYPTKFRLAGLFGLPPESIRVVCWYLGGGFGCKGLATSPLVLGVMAAKLVDRPVKLVLRREQMFGPVGHRGATRQEMRLGTDKAGKLLAYAHHSQTITSSFDDFIEPAAVISRDLYATETLSTSHEAMRADVGTPTFMRAPGEAPGSLAAECAMDEMAVALGIDPLELRLLNYAETEPSTGHPFTSKSLRQCYAQAAERFGWAGRPLAPRQMRDDHGRLLGWGMGTAIFPALMMQAEASARILADGTAVVRSATHDMGQGAWTSMAQIAADGVGLPLSRVRFQLGDTDYPNGGISGGSATTATAGVAIHNAGLAVVAELARLATSDARSPLFGAGNAGVDAGGGRLIRRDDPSRGEDYAAILRRAGLDHIEAQGKAAADPATAEKYAAHAFGAVFAEVAVDPELGQMRVNRLVGAFAAGRIINPRLVRSQYYGGMIWGVSMALHEHAIMDPRSGRVMNANLGEYHVPVNADIPSIEAIIVPEEDSLVNALGVKGVGEIGITGTAGAIANAVYHATGIRVREFPITLDRLLG